MGKRGVSDVRKSGLSSEKKASKLSMGIERGSVVETWDFKHFKRLEAEGCVPEGVPNVENKGSKFIT